MDGRAIVLPEAILAELRAHAREQPPLREAAGRLLVAEDELVVVAYQPLRNVAIEPLRSRTAVSFAPAPGRFAIWTHSHPLGGVEASERDVGNARRLWWKRTFGIFSVRDDELAIWRVSAEGSDVGRLPLVVA